MRVLMLTCHPGIRGPFPKILPLLASALRAEGCHVVEEPWGRHRDDESFFDKIFGRLGDLVRVWRRARREPFDMLVVHTTTEWRNYSRDLPALWLLRRWIPKVVVQFHGSTPELVHGSGHGGFKWATRRLLRMTDGVIVLSSEEKRAWQQFHPQCRWFIGRNPFAAAKPEDIAPTIPWNLPENVPVVLYVGRLIVEKGIFDLLEAAAQLKSGTPFHLLMIGSGPAQNDLEAKVRELKLDEQVTIAGQLDDARTLRRAYRAADLFVLPSWSEGMPTVLLEAMDAGLPIVTTRIRGAVDHFEENVHARMVSPREPKELAAALEELLASPELRARLGANNRQKIREFAPEFVAPEYLAVLQEIAGSKPSPAEGVARAAVRVGGSQKQFK